MLYIKDEDGLYTDDPKKNKGATFIPETTCSALLDSGQDDLVVERVVLEYMQRADNIKSIQIINGTKPGNIMAALNGKHVGSIIHA